MAQERLWGTLRVGKRDKNGDFTKMNIQCVCGRFSEFVADNGKIRICKTCANEAINAINGRYRKEMTNAI